MVRNKLSDLRDHLFEQLERLNDDSLSAEELLQEQARGKSLVELSRAIVDIADLSLKAEEIRLEYGERKSIGVLGLDG